MDLTIVIPARNEEFLKNTVDDILKNKRAKTEIIIGCDGNWPLVSIEDHPDVHIIYHNESIGQRAITNECVKLSRAKYIMKVDAHCSFDSGFDVKLIEKMQDNYTMVPVMRNLHVFDWVCENGHRRYQGPSGVCTVCGKETRKEIIWFAKTNPQSTSYRFDPDPHFQYFNDYKKRDEYKKSLQETGLTETMSLQGSCFLVTREKYLELNLCDEEFGSWGSQGIEVSVKTWLSGGRVVCNHSTWYGHCFRTQGGDFGFPYPLSGQQTDHAKKYARDLFFNNKWEKQIYPLKWLIDKFSPVPDWEGYKFEEETVKPKIHHSVSKGIVYYTDNRLDEKLMVAVQRNLLQCCNGHKIVSVSLKPIMFGENIVLALERSYLTMFKQILAGIERNDSDIIFLCEHDVLYAKSHFDFTPPEKDKYYYNQNTWQVRLNDGFSVRWDCKKLSQLCAYRELLIQHYKERIRRVELEGFSRRMGFEPGSHNRPEKVDDYKSKSWVSEIPNLDIRHDKNLTASRWNQSEFRSQRSCRNWRESNVKQIPGWGEKYAL